MEMRIKLGTTWFMNRSVFKSFYCVHFLNIFIFFFQRPPDTRLRALFIENLSGPLLQMLGTKYSYFYSPFLTTHRRIHSGITLNHFSGPHRWTGFHQDFRKKFRKKSATVSLWLSEVLIVRSYFWLDYRYYNHPNLLALIVKPWSSPTPS